MEYIKKDINNLSLILNFIIKNVIEYFEMISIIHRF